MENIIYTLEKEQKDALKEAGAIYNEIWRGLPDLEFEETKTRSRGGLTALLYEKGEDYIWVPPNARSEYLLKGNRTIFLADRIAGAELYVRWLTPFEDILKAGKIATKHNAEVLAASTTDSAQTTLQLHLEQLQEPYEKIRREYRKTKNGYEAVQREIKIRGKERKEKLLLHEEQAFQKALESLRAENLQQPL